jgi:hypothetical protein
MTSTQALLLIGAENGGPAKTAGKILEWSGRVEMNPSKQRRIKITFKNERGYNPTEQSVFEHVGQQIGDKTHKASRAASAVTGALEDSVLAARRMARDGADAATELLYSAKRRLQRHPLETVAVTFAAGIAAGAAIGWMMRRKKIQP